MQYILEMTHGIHNHWKKSPEHPNRWGYTYNERFDSQLPFVFQRIKADWDEKPNQWGEGVGRHLVAEIINLEYGLQEKILY